MEETKVQLIDENLKKLGSNCVKKLKYTKGEIGKKPMEGIVNNV